MLTIINKIEDYTTALKTTQSFDIPEKGGRKITIPCLNTFLIHRDLIEPNGYNPNHIAPNKMALLVESIRQNGFCFPIVSIFDPEMQKFIIIDGYHRYLMSSKKYLNLEYLPVVCLPHDIKKRMTATLQFNKARGVHQVDLDAEVIKELLNEGLTEEEVCAKLGLSAESVHRYKQLSGVATLFAGASYSPSWRHIDADEI